MLGCWCLECYSCQYTDTGTFQGYNCVTDPDEYRLGLPTTECGYGQTGCHTLVQFYQGIYQNILVSCIISMEIENRIIDVHLVYNNLLSHTYTNLITCYLVKTPNEPFDWSDHLVIGQNKIQASVLGHFSSRQPHLKIDFVLLNLIYFFLNGKNTLFIVWSFTGGFVLFPF